MNYLRQYKSLFATKLNYILDKLGYDRLYVGRLKAIEKVTNEKATTIANWITSGKLPRASKTLSIADSLGVSENYLFNDDIQVTDIEKPEIVKKDNCYLLPVFSEDQIFSIKHVDSIVVKKRIPLMFPSLDFLVKKYGNNIYATKLSCSSFEPQISLNSTIIYSEKTIFEDFALVIIKNEKGYPEIKQVVIEDGIYKLLSFNNGREVIKCFNQNDINVVSIIFSYSE
ncbi:hypothetical protein L3V83_12020 [Thiotrichales bacterium 19X7-9]|nr:hypothetical protein [Thiotrichales bacterium 19X7-9]